MKLLLDSHVWIWLTSDRDRVRDELWEALDSAEALVVSVASLWEIAMKHAAGKLEIPGGMAAMRTAIAEFGAVELPIGGEHALRAAALPPVHRDPFDRMLVAQAEIEGMTLVTADELVRAYGGQVLWAGR